MYQSINLSSCWLTTYIVCVFWIFPRWCCAVLEVWDGFLTGGPKLLEGMAGEGKHCLTRCAQRCEGRRRRAKNRNREKRRQWEKKKVRVTDFCVRHAALQASGRWLIQHDDEPWWINTTQRPVPPRGCSHQSWVKGGGEQPPAASRHRAKMERGHLGHLFIYFLPYAVSSAMLQWVSSMRHKVNAPSTLWGWAGISATRAAYSNSQHRKWPSGRFWMGKKSFFGISLQASRLVLLFVFVFLPAVQELSPQCRDWIKTHKKK